MSFVAALRRNGFTVVGSSESKANGIFRASNTIVRNAVPVLIAEGLTSPRDFAGVPNSLAKSVFTGIHRGGSIDTALQSVRANLERNYFAISLSYVTAEAKRKSLKVTLYQIHKSAQAEVDAIVDAIRGEFPDWEIDHTDATGRFGLPEESLINDTLSPGMSGELVTTIDTLARAVRKNVIAEMQDLCASCKTAEEVRAVIHRHMNPAPAKVANKQPVQDAA